MAGASAVSLVLLLSLNAEMYHAIFAQFLHSDAVSAEAPFQLHDIEHWKTDSDLWQMRFVKPPRLQRSPGIAGFLFLLVLIVFFVIVVNSCCRRRKLTYSFAYKNL